MFLTFIIILVSCPAISLACGLTQDGLPVGLQLVGRQYGDAELRGTAWLLEQALGFDRHVPLEKLETITVGSFASFHPRM
jgi:amidase